MIGPCASATGGAGFACDGRSPKGGASNGGAGFACDGRSPKGGASNGGAGFACDGRSPKGGASNGGAGFACDGRSPKGGASNGGAGFACDGRSPKGGASNGGAGFACDGRSPKGGASNVRRSADGTILPWPSTSTFSRQSVPKPSIRSAASMLTCTSSPATIRTRGAPHRPRASTSQPALLSTSFRAASRQVKFAVCPPVTKPQLTPAGRPSNSTSQAIATSSTAAAAGEAIWNDAFWFQAETSQSAATACGNPDPVTNPKYRGPALATSPGSTARANDSRARAGSSPFSGNGPESASRSSSREARAPTGRIPTCSRYEEAIRQARSKTSTSASRRW